MSADEDALIRLLRDDGDDRAFAELVRRYQSRLRYSLRQLTGYDQALADDLAQETFVRAYQHMNDFRGDGTFFAWLYRIAWRCFMDHHRNRARERRLAMMAQPAASYSPQDDEQLHIDFAKALLAFEPERRMVLHLHLQREFTHAEIAAIMECPLGTVKSHVQRGRAKLQEYMEAWRP